MLLACLAQAQQTPELHSALIVCSALESVSQANTSRFSNMIHVAQKQAHLGDESDLKRLAKQLSMAKGNFQAYDVQSQFMSGVIVGVEAHWYSSPRFQLPSPYYLSVCLWVSFPSGISMRVSPCCRRFPLLTPFFASSLSPSPLFVHIAPTCAVELGDLALRSDDISCDIVLLKVHPVLSWSRVTCKRLHSLCLQPAPSVCLSVCPLFFVTHCNRSERSMLNVAFCLPTEHNCGCGSCWDLSRANGWKAGWDREAGD